VEVNVDNVVRESSEEVSPFLSPLVDWLVKVLPEYVAVGVVLNSA
jgi:hypothetical protein